MYQENEPLNVHARLSHGRADLSLGCVFQTVARPFSVAITLAALAAKIYDIIIIITFITIIIIDAGTHAAVINLRDKFRSARDLKRIVLFACGNNFRDYPRLLSDGGAVNS